MLDTATIKQTSIVEYLASRGLQPDKSKTSRSYTFFLSPLRQERTASFCVNNGKNTWFDYGAGFGGDVIKLVEMVEQCSFLEACAKLAGAGLPRIEVKEDKANIQLVGVGVLSTGSLLRYLSVDRKLNLDFCRKYLHEVHVLINGKRNYMVGFRNDAGGYELRNKYLKIATSPKAITTITPATADERLSIFEGWPDFLSMCTLKGREPKSQVIVLNSASLVKHVDTNDWIPYYYGDNDETGNKLLAKLNANDGRTFYAGHKDLNEYLIAKRQAK